MSGIIEYRQKKTEKKLKKMYEEGFWYLNTYNSLGSKWLLEALNEIDLPSNYRLGSFAANSGFYEADAYNASDKEPVYYISDIHSDNLKDGVATAGSNFKYIKGNIRAQDVTLKMIGNKPLDIIMDIKGALWYALNTKEGSYDDLVGILTTYNKLLNNNGLLLIDWYDFDNYKWKNVLYHIQGGRKRKTNNKYFGELSTKHFLSKLIEDLQENKKESEIKIRPLNVKAKEEGKPLSEMMQVAVLNKKAIQSILNYVRANKDAIKLKYEEAAQKQLGKRVLEGLIMIIAAMAMISITLYFFL